jgi:hypothetical protein
VGGKYPSRYHDSDLNLTTGCARQKTQSCIIFLLHNMTSDQGPSPVPIPAYLACKTAILPLLFMPIGIKIIGDLQKKNSSYFVIISVDDQQVATSKKRPGAPAPRWEWKQHPSL